MSEVAKHSKPDDCWLTVNETVYDVSKFMNEHPGGKKTLSDAAGKDATALFMSNHDPSILESVASTYKIGTLGERI